jgi:hypothetical protein
MNGKTRDQMTDEESDGDHPRRARKGRYRHRDATLILVAYRHGLRATEVCDLEWSQVEFSRHRCMSGDPKTASQAFIRCAGTRLGRCTSSAGNFLTRATSLRPSAAVRSRQMPPID